MSRCRETAGILFKKRCHFPSTQACQQCQKAICRVHVRRVQQTEVCITCARNLVADPNQRGTYAHLRDDPYFFWYYHDEGWFGDPYGAEDYSVFEEGSDFAGGVDDHWEGT